MFDILDIVYGVWKHVVTSYHDVSNHLNTNYPINSTMLCYYRTEKPQEIFFGLRDVDSPFIAGLVFLGLSAAVLVVIGIEETVWGCKVNK